MSLDIEAIRARADAASSGPWRAEGVVNDEVWADDGLVCDTMSTSTGSEANAVFIASARMDVPALCDEVERLRALVVEADGHLTWTLHRHPDAFRPHEGMTDEVKGWINRARKDER